MNQQNAEKQNAQVTLNGINRPRFAEMLSDDIERNTISAEKRRPSKIFYEPVYNKDSKVTDIRIKYRDFTDLLKMMGFVLIDECKPFTYARICANVIEEVSVSRIQQIFLDYVKNEHQPLEGVTRDMIIEKIHRVNSNLFSDSRLSFLIADRPLYFNTDTATESFLYYKNGVVKCSEKGVAFINYEDLGGLIWSKQKIDRNFCLLDWEKVYASEEEWLCSFGYFARFMYRVAGTRMDRFWSLCSITGYCLHYYFDYKLKAIVLTDSKISDKADGRTGKTLFCKALGKVRAFTEINGKDFDPSNKHKYQEANLGCQIVHLNDVKRTFRVEDVFNDITEGIKVEKKNKHPFDLKVKIVISANKTLKIEGASALDRLIEYEFADHYSNQYHPSHEFNHWFFKDWDDKEWNRFDNLMAFCLCYFFKNGLVAPPPINLEKRKLVDATSMDFVEFLDDQFKEGTLKWSIEYSPDFIYNQFIAQYPDYAGNKRFSSPRNFLQFMKQYCEANEGLFTSRRSGGKRWIHFGKDA